MKKHSLFKVILILLALIVIVTYFAPNRTGVASYLGLGDVFVNGLQSFYYFFDTALFLLVVGGFYGVISKTGAYKKLLDNIVTKVKPVSKKFVFAVIVVFALITALTGISNQLIIFVPLVISIILLLGYDKLVAVSSTIGAIIVGFIGGLFVTFRDPSSYYSVYYTTFEEFLDVDKFANLFPKIFLLFAAVALLIFYVHKHIENVNAKKVKYDINNESSDLLIAEVKGNYKDIKTLPLIVILAVILVLMILGLTPWASLFELYIFDDLHTAITSLAIGDYTIFNMIFSSQMTALGTWGDLGSYLMMMIILLLACVVIKFVCKLKFNEVIDGFLEGAKKMLPTAALAIISYTVLVCCYNNGFMETLISNTSEWLGTSATLPISAVFTFLGGLTHVDLYYTAAGIFTPLVGIVADEGLLQVVAICFQTFYGLFMLVGPTSLLLIVGLTYLDIPYTTWLKYIWRLLLELFILIFAVLLIVALI